MEDLGSGQDCCALKNIPDTTEESRELLKSLWSSRIAICPILMLILLNTIVNPVEGMIPCFIDIHVVMLPLKTNN